MSTRGLWLKCSWKKLVGCEALPFPRRTSCLWLGPMSFLPNPVLQSSLVIVSQSDFMWELFIILSFHSRDDLQGNTIFKPLHQSEADFADVSVLLAVHVPALWLLWGSHQTLRWYYLEFSPVESSEFLCTDHVTMQMYLLYYSPTPQRMFYFSLMHSPLSEHISFVWPGWNMLCTCGFLLLVFPSFPAPKPCGDFRCLDGSCFF